MDFILILICFAAIYRCGMLHNKIRTIVAKSTPNLVEGKISSDDFLIHIEYDDTLNMFFVYELNTRQFVVHGTTWCEVESKLKEKYPDTTFGIDKDNADEVGLVPRP